MSELDKVNSNKAAALGGVLLAFLAVLWLIRHLTKDS